MSSTSSTTLTVFRGFPDIGCYVWSPFVTKLEARLRFASIPYRTEAGSVPNAPRGKVPYVSIESPEGEKRLISDSALIIEELIQSGKTADLNQNLPGPQKLQDKALQALLEDKLYYYQGHERWVQNYYTMRDKVLSPIPWPVRVFVGNMVYKKNIRSMEGQGTLKFTAEEISGFRSEIWELLNETIEASDAQHRGEGPFWVWGGEEPTEADAVIFGFIASGLVCDAAPITKALIKSHPALVKYASQIHDKYFSDYTLWG